MRRKVLALLLVLGLAFPVASVASAETNLPDRLDARSLPESVDGLKLESPVVMEGTGLHESLLGATGSQTVIVRLLTPSVSEQKAKGKAAQAAKKQLKGEQDSLLTRVQRLDPNAKVIGQVQLVLNAVFVEVDASVLSAIANDPAVARVAPVGNYEKDLSETVPYIGSTAVQGMGYDGTGVRVAVLDSGIDYTHAAFGGSGDPADWANNDPTVIEPGTFPTAKVVGGYDYIGSEWPLGDLAFDPDPLDDGPEGGHGTHVGHIIAGDGGVAPGADLYAVKVCSSVATSCSGIAMLMGMEFATDPDGDGDPSDAVDVINMSLGSTWGQPFDDDTSLAVDNASALGVLTVASAGNSSNKPYITGTPAAAPSALSVAQTSVPSAILPMMEVLAPSSVAGTYPAVFQPWAAPLTAVIEAPLQYGDGAGGNLLGCAPFPAGSLDGKIVLVNRGTCNFTLKAYNIQNAGGLVGIIGLVAPGDPFQGGDGGDGPITIPTYMISQSLSNQLKAASGVMVRFDPNSGEPLMGTMVGSSSRGPSNYYNMVKPEIGAPGASVSAIYGTGTGTGPFGGTSGAAPMVTGAAALVLQAYPDLSPIEVKARLMNNGETGIETDPFSGLAPISRIGGGEVRVDMAVTAQAAAWDDKLPTSALNFGFVDVSKDTVTLLRTVRVRNYSGQAVEYAISSDFRYPDDAATGAVTLSMPKKVKVQAGKDATFTVKMTIKGAALIGNYMNSGSMGANGDALTMNEFDGYITLDDGSQPIHLPWHVLPRKAASLTAGQVLNFEDGMAMVDLTNTGVGTAQNDAYTLLAVSENLPEGDRGGQSPTPDLRAVGVTTIPVPAGYCSAEPSFIWAFAINTWERQNHLLPVMHQVALDIDRDGEYDYVILNGDFSGNFSSPSDGRQLSWAFDLHTGGGGAYFYAEHSTNTGNTVLLVCGEQVGLTGTDMLNTLVDVDVYTDDVYFGGAGDAITGLTITPLGERYYAVPEDVPGQGAGMMEVYDFGPFPGATPDLGIMLITNGDRGTGNRGGATQDTEALLFMAK